MKLCIIICDYLDKNVKSYLRDKSNSKVLTFFKEPFNDYRGNKVLFIDDILDESDYIEIDNFVNRILEIVGDIFSIYLRVDEYYLFNYLKLQVKEDFGKIYKYKYSIDKIINRDNIGTIYFFCSEKNLLKWLKLDYNVESKDNYQVKDINKYKFKIMKYFKNIFFINYVFDKTIAKLFRDCQKKYKKNILWMGSRTIDSQVLNELRKENNIFLLQNSINKLRFIKRKYKFNLLRLKNHKNFREKWKQIKYMYKKGLKKISYETKLNSNLLEIILRINENVIKDLLLTLLILKDSSDNVDLLIVEQSVEGSQALAVDFFNKKKLPSIEVLHGVPSRVQVGKTDKIAVYGKRDKSFFSRYGVDESKIKITGCAYYDKIFDIKDEEKKYDFLLLILDWIGYVPSISSHKIIYKQVVMMLKLLQYFTDEKLVIKLHPGQSIKEVEYISHLTENIIRIKNRVKIVKDVNVISLLKDAKIVYNYHSSVGVEALLMKKPLIILDLFWHRSIEYEKHGGCLVVKNYEELLLATEEILKGVHGYLKKNKENIEKTRQYFSGDLKGKSYKNVIGVINEMLYK